MKITIELLQEAINSLRSEPIVIQIISGCLLFFVVLFFVRFVIPAIWVGFQYGGIIRQLRRIKRTKDRDLTPIFA